MFDGVLNSSMMWKAQKDGAAEFQLLNLRDFGLGPRRQVDDKPFGGGAGMLLMIEPLTNAIEEAKRRLPNAKVLLMTPTDNIWNQSKAAEFANSAVIMITLLCVVDMRDLTPALIALLMKRFPSGAMY